MKQKDSIAARRRFQILVPIPGRPQQNRAPWNVTNYSSAFHLQFNFIF
jgi:hypothetical protein